MAQNRVTIEPSHFSVPAMAWIKMQNTRAHTQVRPCYNALPTALLCAFPRASASLREIAFAFLCAFAFHPDP